MKKKIISMALGIFLAGTTQEVLATENLPTSHFETSELSTRAAPQKIWFKSIPPLKYQGKTRINYTPSKNGYLGTYL